MWEGKGKKKGQCKGMLIVVDRYCGAPAGMEGFKVAERVIKEMREQGVGPKKE